MNQFFRFCVVGAVGFVIDAGILQSLVSGIGANPYLARIISFLVAASATWLMNRRYTFEVEHAATHSEWVRYVALMVLGAVVNYGAFAISITAWSLARAQPWLGVAVGSVAGLGINFMTSRLLFRGAST
ncbi:MAG: GtrA family protein [Sulfuricella sp.]|nr:GtrA family protein [Sulfuricella sp.]